MFGLFFYSVRKLKDIQMDGEHQIEGNEAQKQPLFSPICRQIMNKYFPIFSWKISELCFNLESSIVNMKKTDKYVSLLFIIW